MSCDCEVLANCKNAHIAWWCNDYDEYRPKNKKVLSPRQIKNRVAKKEAKKELKKTDRSKIGKRNKSAGKRVERELEKLLSSWGLSVRRVPLSGALKSTNLVGGLENNLAGDLILEVGSGPELRKYRIESKKRENINRLYSLAGNDDGVHISGFCYLMDEQTFKNYCDGLMPFAHEIEDKNFVTLHRFFDQDDSDIVAMKTNYKCWLFAVHENKIEELKGVTKNEQ